MLRMPLPGIGVEIPLTPEMLLREVVVELLLDLDEDSMALASAIEIFAFALAKLVSQTLI